MCSVNASNVPILALFVSKATNQSWSQEQKMTVVQNINAVSI